MSRILVADDDPSVLETIAYALEREDFDVDTVEDGEAALAAARNSEYDLLILNVMMPRLFGTDVVRELQRETETPIVLLSARDGRAERIEGLELGADDYITKPFSLEELVSRVRAILRRQEFEHRHSPLLRRLDRLDMNYEDGAVFSDGRRIPLTRSEFRLLGLLADHPGRGRQPQGDSRAPVAERVCRGPARWGHPCLQPAPEARLGDDRDSSRRGLSPSRLIRKRTHTRACA